MKITLLCVGKTDKGYLETGVSQYLARLQHYVPLEVQIIPELKNAKSLSEQQQKEAEGWQILAAVGNSELCLLDQRGTAFSSVQFAAFLQKKMLSSTPNLCFVVGGAYGFSAAVYARAQAQIALSAMTFSHQMVRLFFVEQLYRAFTILKGTPYHHG
ncbi:ribosomal RNA large subunit methyltransferase H [Bacteroidia bacterium]|nr:ribosomal RNA large subunit methyltransferase H [Bacteroidia bacterium]